MTLAVSGATRVLRYLVGEHNLDLGLVKTIASGDGWTSALQPSGREVYFSAAQPPTKRHETLK